MKLWSYITGLFVFVVVLSGAISMGEVKSDLALLLPDSVQGWKVAAKTDTDCKFSMIAIEKEAPFVTGIFPVGPSTIGLGRRKYRNALTKYVDCLASDFWPGYFTGEYTLEAPEWCFNTELNERG